MLNKISKKVILILIVGIMLLLLGTINSYAAGFSVSPSSATVNVGGTTKITVTATGCAGRFTFISSDSSIVSIDKTEEFWDNTSGIITLTGKKAGTATITVTADDVADDAKPNPNPVVGSKKINVTVKAKDEEIKAAEPNFTAVNQTVYAKSETNVRESYSTSSKSYGMLPAGESVTRTGIGDNGWSKVTYNGKTAYIYSNNLTTTKPEETKSADKALKSLKITEGTLEPEFDPETTKYSITVPNNVEQAKIEALANSEKATVAITGNEKLVMGSNLVKITVTAEDGTTRIYNLEVVKTNQEPAQLMKLEIPGVTLEPAFSPEVYQYKIQLDANSTVTDFAILAQANLEDATVEIIGNSNFKEGENIITILVTSANGTEMSSYQIIVNKLPASSQGMLSGNNGKTNIALIAIGALVVVAIVIVIIAIIKKRRAEENFDDDIDPYKPSFNDDDLDIEEDLKKEDFTGIYKRQIMDDDEMEAKQTMQQTGRFQNQNISAEPQIEENNQEDDEDYIPDTKQEKNIDNTMEMTRRYSTNYDYTLEQQYKKTKNTGKGKHF